MDECDPHYEMKLIDLLDGGKAWVCDNIEWAIYPQRYAEHLEGLRNSPVRKLLSKSVGDGERPED